MKRALSAVVLAVLFGAFVASVVIASSSGLPFYVFAIGSIAGGGALKGTVSPRREYQVALAKTGARVAFALATGSTTAFVLFAHDRQWKVAVAAAAVAVVMLVVTFFFELEAGRKAGA